MRLTGRITVYGEHLMGGEAFGLITPSLLYLADGDDLNAQSHPVYNPEIDSVRAMLQAEDLPTTHVIRGNLPFGYGFASSTVLALLHLHADVPHDVMPIVDRLDTAIHGFSASGVDGRFQVKRCTGLYRKEKWIDIDHDFGMKWSCALLPKERAMMLPQAREIIRAHRATLAIRAEDLTKGVLEGHLSHERLLDYSRHLLQIGAYSADARRVIQYALERGIVAKGIGGIYDKAVVFLKCSVCCGASPGALASVEDTVREIDGAQWIAAA